MVEVVVFDTPELGDRSYLVHDGEVAFVVDPQRDYGRVLEAAAEAGVRIAAVAETHMHNDYVTGGTALAKEVGADYLVSADDHVSFQRVPVADGEEYQVGSFSVKVMATAGHTPSHVSYLVQEGGKPRYAFTGGSLLYGTVGRPDLLGEEMTDFLARAQYHSARRLADLPDDVKIYPTHGFGSFCSSSQSDTDHVSTAGEERQSNIACTTEDEDRFVSELLAALAPYPRYYAHMGARNVAGPGAPDLSPVEEVDPVELRNRLDRGEWVVDLRSRTAFAKGHLPGSVSMEGGSSFITYLGWLIPWGSPITLIGDSEEAVSKAQRDMALIGIERPAGKAVGDIESLARDGKVTDYPVATFADLAKALASDPDIKVIDVRRADEWVEGHIEGAHNYPIHELPDRVGELPREGRLWVHCAGGYRASVAASLIDREGRDVVVVDDAFDQAGQAGLPIVS